MKFLSDTSVINIYLLLKVVLFDPNSRISNLPIMFAPKTVSFG